MEPNFFALLERHIQRLEALGKPATARNCRSAARSLQAFHGSKPLPLDAFDKSLTARYEAWLRGRGVCPNTRSFYLRTLRSVYRRAVAEGMTADRQPFAEVYTGIAETRKRAVPADDIRSLKALNLCGKPQLQLARDVFLFSFYCRGMAFVDLAHLRKSNVQGGAICYIRRKTGQTLRIALHDRIQALLDKYRDARRPYLLPLLTGRAADEEREYQAALRRINYSLHRLSLRAGLPEPLTTYTARHTWASIAKAREVPLAVISDALGHTSALTTQIYLASLDDAVLARANDVVLEGF